MIRPRENSSSSIVRLKTYLNGVLVCQEVDDLERMCNNADGQELLAVVATLHHQARTKKRIVGKTHVRERVRRQDEFRGVKAHVVNTHLSTNRSTMGI